MTALTLDLKAWLNIRKKEMKEFERGKKEEKRGYPNNKIMCRVVYGKRHMACRAVQYATLMFYHNIQANDDTNNRIKQQSTKEVENNLGITFLSKSNINIIVWV